MRLLKDVYGTSDEGKNNFHVKVSSFHVQRSNLYQSDRFAAKIKPVQNLSVGACQRRPHAHQGTTHLPENIGKMKLNLNRTKSRTAMQGGDGNVGIRLGRRIRTNPKIEDSGNGCGVYRFTE